MGSAQKAAGAAQIDRPSGDLTPVAPLLEMMSALPLGDPARQAEIFQSAKDGASLTPTTTNKLKYALADAVSLHRSVEIIPAIPTPAKRKPHYPPPAPNARGRS